MTQTAKFVIVGGGLEGLAIAWSLADRGETDMLVLERDTLCSGMTGKSSGVVRCHYGTPSLAAMSWYGVDIFTRATEIFGDDMAFRQCGYVVGVGENNIDPLKANVAMMQGLGIDVDYIGPRQDGRTVAGAAPRRLRRLRLRAPRWPRGGVHGRHGVRCLGPQAGRQNPPDPRRWRRCCRTRTAASTG